MRIIKLSLLSLFLIFSCGLDTYIYLEPVPNPNIIDVNSVTIYLPSRSSQPDEFRHYIIYYRIYLSNHPPAGTPNDHWYRNDINPALATHFNILNSLTTTDIVSAALVMSEFNRLSYFPLYYESSLGNYLPISSLLTGDGVVYIDFTPDNIGPFVRINQGADIPLIRSDTANPTPSENNSFFHSEYLISETGQGINSDVHRHEDEYLIINRSYVSMYIIAFGIDNNYSPMYSRATHIGIFLLPD